MSLDLGTGDGNFSGNAILSETHFQGLLDNLTYINIHTSFRPDGEIRGQIISPEPASMTLLAAAALMLLKRRRG